MRTFAAYAQERGLREDIDDIQNPADGFKLNRDEDMGQDYDHTLTELIKAVMTKYEQETMQFLHGIADRGDQEVADLLRKLDKEHKPSELEEPRHPTDIDNEVIPPIADTGHSETGGD